MRRGFYFFGIMMLALGILSCSCGKQESAGKRELKSGSLTIIYSSNIGAMMYPCGCRVPMGGLARRATVVRQIKSEVPDALVLDSGALLYPSQYLYPPYDEIGKRTSYFIADIVSDIGIDALNVSSYDLAFGPDSLLTFDAKYDADWLSCNIVRRGETDIIFTPDKTYESGGFTVGVFGIMSRRSMGVEIFRDDAPVDVLDHNEAAKKEVAKLKPKSDLIVALAYMDLVDVKRMIELNPDINVVVMSHTQDHNPSSEHNDFLPIKFNDALIVRCPDGGRVVGRLDLDIVKGGLTFVDAEKYIDLRPEELRKADPAPTSSTFSHTFTDLDKNIEFDPVVSDRINEYAKKLYAFTDTLDIDYRIP